MLTMERSVLQEDICKISQDNFSKIFDDKKCEHGRHRPNGSHAADRTVDQVEELRASVKEIGEIGPINFTLSHLCITVTLEVVNGVPARRVTE
jgi:hypothetical protein